MKPVIGFVLIALVLGAAFYLYATLSPRLEASSAPEGFRSTSYVNWDDAGQIGTQNGATREVNGPSGR